MLDTVIIGAGTAGIAAAIQLKRYNIDPVILEKNKIGGLLKNANLVENYPGFPDGISGVELVELFKKHLNRSKISVEFEEVTGVDYQEHFIIETNKRTLFSRTLIIASGTNPGKLDIPEIKDKIFSEIMPVIHEKGKKIAIIGAGDCAFDYALNLSRHNQILILNRSNKTKCLPVLWERCLNNQNISYFENTEIKNVTELDEKLLLVCNNQEIQADYLITAIGREANLDFLSDNFRNKIKKLENEDLLFIIGDVNNNIYRQSAICAGDGVKSAMRVYRKLMI